jgi:hypothetical protein
MLLSASLAALVANRIALGFSEGPADPVAVHDQAHNPLDPQWRAN